MRKNWLKPLVLHQLLPLLRTKKILFDAALFKNDSYSKEKHRAYPVLSAYFDTSNLDYFYQKINGEFDHTKIRLRTYDRKFTHGTKVFLEAKKLTPKTLENSLFRTIMTCEAIFLQQNFESE